jgi:hypothetical protein
VTAVRVTVRAASKDKELDATEMQAQATEALTNATQFIKVRRPAPATPVSRDRPRSPPPQAAAASRRPLYPTPCHARPTPHAALPA